MIICLTTREGSISALSLYSFQTKIVWKNSSKLHGKSEDNFLLSEEEDSLVSESYDTNDEIEFEELESVSANNIFAEDDAGPYSSEPLADDEWLREYYREREIMEENERQLQNRLDRVVEIDSWK